MGSHYCGSLDRYNFVAPLALLSIQTARKYLVELGVKIPIDIPGITWMKFADN